jgi:hypothetical protein
MSNINFQNTEFRINTNYRKLIFFCLIIGSDETSNLFNNGIVWQSVAEPGNFLPGATKKVILYKLNTKIILCTKI